MAVFKATPYQKRDGESNSSNKSVFKATKYKIDNSTGDKKRVPFYSIDTSGVDESYINTFVSDANSFLSSAEKDYGTVGWGNASSVYDGRSSTWQDLESRADTIEAWLYKNKANLDSEAYDNLSTAVSSYRSNASSIVDAFKNAKDYYSQWSTEDEYNTYEGYRSVLDAPDFATYSQMGANIENPTYAQANASDNALGWKNPFKKGAEINNIVTFSRDNMEAIGKAIGGVNNNADLGSVIGDYRYQFLEDDEVAIYNYYLGKGEKEKAAEYLASLDDILNRRHAVGIVERTDDTALEAVFSLAAGLESGLTGFVNLGNMITGKDGVATSATQYAQGTMRENNTGIWKVTNDLSNSLGNMLPSIAVGMVTGGAGGALTMGASSTGNAYAEMRDRGYDKWQARGYGVLVGASEAALSYVLGGISPLGSAKGGVISKATTKALGQVDNALARFAIKWGSSMLDEAIEESAQSVLEPIFNHIFTGEAVDVDWGEVAYSGLLGALSAGFLEAIPTAVESYGESKNAKLTKEYFGGETEALLAEAAAIKDQSKDSSKAVDKYIEKYGKKGKLSGTEISNLIDVTDKGKIKAGAEAILAEYGEKGDISKVAEVIAKIRVGEEITKAERDILVNSEYGRRVSTESNPDIINNGGYNTGWAEKLGTRRINAKEYNKGILSKLPDLSDVETPIAVAEPPEEASATEAEVVSPEDIKTTIERDGEEVETNNEQLVAEIASDNVSRVEGFTEEAATAMMNGYDGSIDPSQYTISFNNAFKMGASGVPSSKLVGVINSGISERVAYTAYELGRQSAEKRASALNSLSNNGIINTNESEAKNESGESIHLRNGSKRDGGKNTEGQVSRMEGSTGQTESRGKDARIADSEATRLVNEGREVKVADLGILGGSTEQTVRLVDKANETTSMKEARKRAEKRGLKVTFFVGDNLVIKDKGGEWISARAFIKGNHVFVRADHSLYTADQLMRHELGHDMIAKGEVDIKAVRERLEKTVGKENIDEVSKLYAEAYEGTGMSAEDIWEECICDSLGDMNIFAGNEVIGTFLDSMLPEIKAASKSKSPTQTRGSPNTQSAKPRGKTTESKAEAKAEAVATEKVSLKENVGKEGKEGYEFFNGLEESSAKSSESFNVGGIVISLNTNSNAKHINGIRAKFTVTAKNADQNGTWRQPEHFSSFEEAQAYASMLSYEAGDYIAESNNDAGKASRETYTKDEYQNYGWARANKVLTASESEDLRSKFAAAVSKQAKYPKTKASEYMIAVGEDVDNKIAYMKGTIDNPVITRVLEIDVYNETKLDEIRRDVYATERTGIQRQTGGVFTLYTGADFRNNVTPRKGVRSGEGHNNQLGSDRRRGSSKASGVKEILFDDEGNEVSRKYSRELDDQYSQLYSMRTEVNKLREDIKKIESSDDFKAQMNKLSEALANDDVAGGVKVYENWKKESGYGELITKRDELEAQISKLSKELEDNRVNEALNAEQEAIKKSGLSEADYFRKQAVKEFGYTPHYYDAGYILPNGKMLNFSGEKGKHFGSRGEDHRAIGMIYATTQGTDALVRFMNDGNIRIMAESPGLDIASNLEPTREQYSIIRSFIYAYANQEYFNIDLSDERGRVVGSLEYEGRINPTRIINDIKHYYETGEIREQSNVDKFRYSRELDTERVSYAPTFYSHMGKVIDDIKLEKMGGESLLNHLKNRGVKTEELKWSGIEVFLEGKKSVTKAELQEFVAGSQLQIEEEMSDVSPWDIVKDGEDYIIKGNDGEILERWTYDEGAKIWASDEDGTPAPGIASIKNFAKEMYGDGGTRWGEYTLDGGSNYRELVFKMPNSTYSNNAMRTHWGDDAEGILVHTRVQDFVVDGKKMLFIEELQSDWHNEGREKGYTSKEYEDAVAVYDKLADDYSNKRRAFNQYVRSSEYKSDPDEVSKKKFNWLRSKMETAEKRMQDAERDVEALKKKGMGDVTDAPFRDNYHEYVLKRLLRMAAEEGYDSIGWTPSWIQSERWSEEFAEAYRIEYDQEMPKFLRKYGKKWGATVGKAEIEVAEHSVNGEHYDAENIEVWSMDISDSMKESVLYEGQPKYSRELDLIDYINEQAGEESDPNLTKAQQVAKVRGELESMNVGKGEIMSVMKLADQMLDVYGGDSRISDFRYGLFEATKLALNGSETGFEAAYEIIHTLAREVAYNPKNAGGDAALLSEIKQDIRGTKLFVHDADKTSGEFDNYGGYGAFRKNHLGKFMLGNDGVKVDKKYAELQELYGTSFFPDINTIPEQLLQMAKLMDTPLSEYMFTSEAELDYTVDEMVNSLFGKLGNIWDGAIKSGGVIVAPIESDKFSNRSLLTGALETIAQNDIERNKLEQYKQKIDLINAEEQKLLELRIKIKELSFAKGPRDTKAIRDLQFEANQAANRINTYDRQLLNLESTKALKGVLEREKAQAFKRAEKKGKEALARQREKAAETQRELMTRYQESRMKATEGRNKTAMRHKIKDVVNELNQYLLKGTKEKHIPIELQKPVAEALDAVNMDTVGAEERIVRLQAEMMKAKTPEAIQEIAKKIEHIEEMGGNMEAKLSRLKTAYDNIINSEDPIVANSHDEVISNTIQQVIKDVGETPLRDMSLAQLEAVYDMYRMVLHSIRTANKAFKAKKSEEISVIANGVLEEVGKLGKKKALRTKMGDAASTFDWNNLKPTYAFERIGSDTFTEVFNNVRAGEDTWAVDMTEAQEFLENKKKDHKYDSWDFNESHKFTSSTGKEFSLSLGQIMSLYAYSKRGDQAKDHLRNGGFVFDGLTEVKQKGKLGVTKTYQLKDATAYNLNDAILADIISKLSAEQKAFADVMQDYLSTVMGEKGNEVSLELYGVKLFKEKNYFPLKSAPQFLERAREQAQGDVKIKNKGFTKETAPKASNPIVLTSFMDVWAGHVNEMSMYHAFTLALEDFYRVYNYKTPASETMDSESVISFLENAHGAASVSYIDQLLKDLNGGARSDPRETVAKSLMSRFKKSAVMASLSVVVQQPTSIVRAMALVDAKYFGVAPISRGVLKALNPKKHKALWAEVKKYAPVAIIKEMGYFDTGMGKSSVEWLKGEKTFMDKVDDALTKAPAVADELAWISIWEAVKRETAHNNTTLDTNSEEFLKLAGERFTEVIVKTQVYDSTLAKSSNMRSKSGLMNMWTAFMAEPTTTINMVMDAFRKGDKKYIAKVLGATAGSIALNAALVSLVYAMRDDDEDETYLEKYLSRFTTEFIDGINPVTYIPFFKDVWSIMQGFDIERTDMALISDLISTAQNAVKTLTKDTSDMDEEELSKHQKDVSEALWGIVDSISSLAGVPFKNVRRDTNGIINLFETLGRDVDTSFGSLMDNIVEDLHSSTPVWNLFKGESKTEKLYDAITSGDTAYVDRIKGSYKNESSYNSAVRKALRENDPRIKEAAEAYNDGDYDTYESILTEIVGEGHFDGKLVSDTIRAEAKAIAPKEEEAEADTTEEGTEEAYSIYQANDINIAFENGDTARAKEIIADLIETKVANGMDEKKAKSSLRSSMTSYWKPLYKAASESERIRIRKILYNSGLYGTVNEVNATASSWLKD